jgi:hypothetical protein
MRRDDPGKTGQDRQLISLEQPLETGVPNNCGGLACPNPEAPRDVADFVMDAR